MRARLLRTRAWRYPRRHNKLPLWENDFLTVNGFPTVSGSRLHSNL